jgi:WD40 repeat protein
VATGGFVRWFLDDVATSSPSVAFSGDGSKIALGNRQFAQVFSVATGALLHEFTTTNFFITAIALSDDGTLLAAGSEDQLLTWELAGETLLWSAQNSPVAGSGLLFSRDGARLYSSGRFNGIQIRSATNGTVLRTYDEEIGESITSLAMSPSERNFAYTRSDATIVVARNPFWTTGDTNADGCVDLTDLASTLSDFGVPHAPGRADFNDDGVIDLADLSLLLANFGVGCQ